jgi:hypothetical protein
MDLSCRAPPHTKRRRKKGEEGDLEAILKVLWLALHFKFACASTQSDIKGSEREFFQNSPYPL